jgi:hypothetical protein
MLKNVNKEGGILQGKEAILCSNELSNFTTDSGKSFIIFRYNLMIFQFLLIWLSAGVVATAFFWRTRLQEYQEDACFFAHYIIPGL